MDFKAYPTKCATAKILKLAWFRAWGFWGVLDVWGFTIQVLVSERLDVDVLFRVSGRCFRGRGFRRQGYESVCELPALNRDPHKHPATIGGVGVPSTLQC